MRGRIGRKSTFVVVLWSEWAHSPQENMHLIMGFTKAFVLVY